MSLLAIIAVLVLVAGGGWCVRCWRPDALTRKALMAKKNESPRGETPMFRRVAVKGQLNSPPSLTSPPQAGRPYFVAKGLMKAQVKTSPVAPCWLTGESMAKCTCKECKNARANSK